MAQPRPTLRRNTFVLAALLACVSGLCAQSRPADNGIALQLMVLDDVSELLQPGNRPAPLTDVFYLAPDGSYLPIKLQDTARTAPVRYRGPQPLTLYTQSTNEAGQPVYQPAFSVQLGSGWQSALILLIPSSAAQGGYHLLPIDTSKQSIREGTIKVYNISTAKLAINADGKTSQIAPMQSVTIDISGIQNNMLPVALASRSANGFQIVYKRNWSMRSNIRGIFLLYPQGEHTGRWVMRNIIL